MDSLTSKVESILFVAGKPLALKKIAKALGVKTDEAAAAVGELSVRYHQAGSGIVVMNNGDEWQMATNPKNQPAAEGFIKAEIAGELTRPQLETLTVISYCGPITKPELEQIRGVNCGLILRNLLMRGLVKESDSTAELLPAYEVTMDFVRHLGLASISDLPDYAELRRHEFISKTLEQNNQ